MWHGDSKMVADSSLEAEATVEQIMRDSERQLALNGLGHQRALRRRGFVFAALLGAIALSTSASAAPPSDLWTERTFATPLDPDAPVSMRAFSKLARELSPAVVNIGVKKKRVGAAPFLPVPDGQGLGTGFIIHERGLVLTNHHVIDGADEIIVKLSNDQEYVATIVGSYQPLDVALLKIDPKEKLTAAPLGDSNRVEIGEWVIAIGNPFGLNHTVTAGIVSAKGRRDISPGAGPNLARFIQTDASINPGNSGGPLINIRGEVIGINTAINPAGQGIGFAVPIDMIKTVMPQLATGKVLRSYLGIVVGPLQKEVKARLGSGGAYVSSVKENGPAARAGIEAGDIITHIDGKPIEHWEDLPWYASIAGISRAVPLTVHRGGKTRELDVMLAPYPENASLDVPTRNPRQTPDSELDLGLQVERLPDSRAKEVGLEPGQGVIVKSAVKDGIGARLGIKAGDVVTHVNEQVVQGVEGFAKLVRGTDARISLAMRRGTMMIFKSLQR